jgi:surface polysaccharide O-acyltransferase-like enzyme
MERSTGLDNLRILAGIAVVLLHVSGFAFRAVEAGFTAIWWTGNAVNSATRWSVPVFVMISGALLLPRTGETAATFYRKRASRLLVPLAFWPVFYAALDLHLHDRAVTAGRVLRAAFVRTDAYYHLWFLYMIVGLYALTPLLRPWVRRASPRALLVAAAIAFLPFLAAPTPWIGDPDRFRGWLGCLPYLGYYLLGAALATRERTWPPAAAAATALVAIAVTILGTRALVGIWGMGPEARALQDNLGPFTLAASVGLFEWARRSWGTPWLGRFQAAGAGAVFGVYLVHPFFLEMLWRAGLRVEPSGPWWSVLTTGLAVLAASAAAVLALQRIPGARRLV